MSAPDQPVRERAVRPFLLGAILLVAVLAFLCGRFATLPNAEPKGRLSAASTVAPSPVRPQDRQIVLHKPYVAPENVARRGLAVVDVPMDLDGPSLFALRSGFALLSSEGMTPENPSMMSDPRFVAVRTYLYDIVVRPIDETTTPAAVWEWFSVPFVQGYSGRCPQVLAIDMPEAERIYIAATRTGNWLSLYGATVRTDNPPGGEPDWRGVTSAMDERQFAFLRDWESGGHAGVVGISHVTQLMVGVRGRSLDAVPRMHVAYAGVHGKFPQGALLSHDRLSLFCLVQRKREANPEVRYHLLRKAGGTWRAPGRPPRPGTNLGPGPFERLAIGSRKETRLLVAAGGMGEEMALTVWASPDGGMTWQRERAGRLPVSGSVVDMALSHDGTAAAVLLHARKGTEVKHRIAIFPLQALTAQP